MSRKNTAAAYRTRCFIQCVTPLLASCSASPAQTVMGSFFPSWMLCALLGLIAATGLRFALAAMGVHSYLIAPLLTYIAVALAVAMLIWLLWFGH